MCYRGVVKRRLSHFRQARCFLAIVALLLHAVHDVVGELDLRLPSCQHVHGEHDSDDDVREHDQTIDNSGDLELISGHGVISWCVVW